MVIAFGIIPKPYGKATPSDSNRHADRTAHTMQTPMLSVFWPEGRHRTKGWANRALGSKPFKQSFGKSGLVCLPHHDDYDSVRSQTKRLTPDEVRTYRAKLYEQLAKPPFTSSVAEEPIDYYEESDIALNVIYRYAEADKPTSRVIAAEILTRIEKLYQFYRLEKAEHEQLDRFNHSVDDLDKNCWDIRHRLLEQLGLPSGIYGLSLEEEMPTSQWLRSARRLAKKWAAGELSYEQCKDVLWVFDTEFDLDPFYMLFGIPAEDMSKMQMRALKAFIFEHGQREYNPFLAQGTDNVPF